MKSTDPRPRRLISDRFRYIREESAFAGESQQKAMRTFLDRVKTGAYRFVSDPCPCARPTADVVVAEVDRYRLPLTSVLCLGCGTVRIDPYLDAASLEDFYRTLYQDLYGRLANPDEYFERQRVYGRKVLAAVAGHPPRTVLEIGCGGAGGLSVFHEAGLFVAGCDYSSELIEYGVRKGVPNLHVGPIQEVAGKLGRDRFDLIYLHHVFEHVDTPEETLRALAGLLAPGGRILVIVPQLAGIHTHRYPAGDAIGVLHVAHKYNYTPLGLDLIARRVGMGGQRTAPPAGMPTAWTDGPELWMNLCPEARTPPTSRPPAKEPGRVMLRYLRRTERLYRWGLCPAQLVQRWSNHPCVNTVAWLLGAPTGGR